MRIPLLLVSGFLVIAACTKSDSGPEIKWSTCTFTDSMHEVYNDHYDTSILRVENLGLQLTDSPFYALFRGDTFNSVSTSYTIAAPDYRSFRINRYPYKARTMLIHLPTDSTVIFETVWEQGHSLYDHSWITGKR